MNPSTSIPSIPSRETSSPLGVRPESIALGLLLIGACLPTVIPHPRFEAEAPMPAQGLEAMHRLREHRAFPHPASHTGGPSDTGIRPMPIILITADAIVAEEPSAPLPQAVATVPAVEIVPLASLRSMATTRP
jgi:hypothetical protein